MERKTKTIKLPFALAIGSFIVLALITMLTNPQQSIASIPPFFISLWLAVFSLLWLLANLLLTKQHLKIKTHIALIATAFTLFLMLKSTGEIRPIDTAVLLLLIAGLVFYINRKY